MGPFKYYVSKEVGGWGGQMLMFADKVGGWGWPNADVSTKKVSKEKNFFLEFFSKLFFLQYLFYEHFFLCNIHGYS